MMFYNEEFASLQLDRISVRNLKVLKKKKLKFYDFHKYFGLVKIITESLKLFKFVILKVVQSVF